MGTVSFSTKNNEERWKLSLIVDALKYIGTETSLSETEDELRLAAISDVQELIDDKTYGTFVEDVYMRVHQIKKDIVKEIFRVAESKNKNFFPNRKSLVYNNTTINYIVLIKNLLDIVLVNGEMFTLENTVDSINKSNLMGLLSVYDLILNSE